MARRRLIGGALALAACGPGSATSPGAPSASGPSNPAPPAEVARPSPELLASAPRLSERVDPRRGLAYLAYYTDPTGADEDADETGLVKRAERLCGDALAPMLAHLERQLAIAGEPWRCVEWTCERAGSGEYSLDDRYEFAPVGGELRLVAVVQIEGGPVTEEFTAEAEAWADGELERLAAAPRCDR